MSDKQKKLFRKDELKLPLDDAFICDPFPRFVLCITLVAIVAALCVAFATYPAVKAKNDAADAVAAQARSSALRHAPPVSP